jgi:hypothetical protein
MGLTRLFSAVLDETIVLGMRADPEPKDVRPFPESARMAALISEILVIFT